MKKEIELTDFVVQKLHDDLYNVVKNRYGNVGVLINEQEFARMKEEHYTHLVI